MKQSAVQDGWVVSKSGAYLLTPPSTSPRLSVLIRNLGNQEKNNGEALLHRYSIPPGSPPENRHLLLQKRGDFTPLHL